MNIKEAEQRSGLERANIRYYEQEGLLSPARASNGYRSYSEDDLRTLRRIRLLRTLGVSLSDLRALQAGTEALSAVLTRRMEALARAQEEAADARALCAVLQADRATYDTLDPEKYTVPPAAPAVPYPAREDLPAPPPGPWRRLLARGLDLALCRLALLAVQELALRSPAADDPPIVTVLLALLSAAVLLFAEPLLLHLTGTTAGKALMGLHLEDENGGRPSYAAAFDRTARALWRGMAFDLPGWRLIRLYKSWKRAENGGVQPWDDTLVYTARPMRWYRGLCCLAAWAALFFGVVLILGAARLPVRRGPLTVAAYAESYNELARYHRVGTPLLAEDGSWSPDGQRPGSLLSGFVNGPDPLLTYRVEEGTVTGVTAAVTLRADGEPALVAGYGDRFALLALALAAAQPGTGPLSAALTEIPETILGHSFEDYAFSAGGVTVTCAAEYSGFHEIDGSLLHRAEDGPAALCLTFTVSAG